MDQFTLENSNIVIACRKVSEFLKKEKVNSSDSLRITLAMEELLIKYQEDFGETECFSLRLLKRMGSLSIELSVSGTASNPFEQDSKNLILRGLLSGFGLAPVWRYKNGKNFILFTAKKITFSYTSKIFAGIFLAVLAGLLSGLMPTGLKLDLSESLITMLIDTFMGLLTAVAGPLIFFSILGSICGMGDLETLGEIGQKTVRRLLLTGLIINTFLCFLMLPFFKISTGSGSHFECAALISMILDIVPENMITPFIEGNSMQIVFWAVLFGIVLLAHSNKTSEVTALSGQLGHLINTIMGGICSFLPIFIFCVIFNMFLQNNFGILLHFYKILVLACLGYLFTISYFILLASWKNKISPLMLIKKLLPTFLLALTTASSAAAFTTNIDCCSNKLGINHKLVNFGIPLGQVIFMPGYISTFWAVSLFMANECAIDITFLWLSIAFISIFILSVSAPPMPGSLLLCYSILFSQLGIPLEMVGLVAALDVFLDFLGTATNVLSLQCELLNLSRNMKLLNTDILHQQ